MWGRSIFESRRRETAMRPATRLMLAYIAGELILHRGFRQVLDYGTGDSLNLKLRETEFDIELSDGDRARVLLHGSAFGKHYSLILQQDQSRVELTIAGRNFDGTDTLSGSKFKGVAKDKLVTFVEGGNQYAYGLS